MLRPGISGYSPPHGLGVSRSEFLAVLNAAAGLAGFRVAEVDLDTNCRSFFVALLRRRGREVYALCNTAYPVAAFSDAVPELFDPSVSPKFLALPELARAVVTVAPSFEVASPEELSRPLVEAELALLTDFERSLTANWNARTVADVVFNSWP